MKNYKQILEAVNRGIKFALDDFDDQDDIQGQSNSKVNHKHGTKDQLELMNNTVDLGLPSGTLWCKYNVGADTDHLNWYKNWYGCYFAWGETDIKDIYDWSNYKWAENNAKRKKLLNWDQWEMNLPFMTKYCNYEKYGLTIDNKQQLDLQDDAAYVNNLNNQYYEQHIPTINQIRELLQYTTYEYVHNYKKIRSLDGCLFISKINNEELFFPFTGFRSRSKSVLNGKNTVFNIVSNEPGLNTNARKALILFGMHIRNNIDIEIKALERRFGRPIRGVVDNIK